MKLFFISVIYCVEALVFDVGVYFVMKLNPSSKWTAFVARMIENIGDEILKKECYIQEQLK